VEADGGTHVGARLIYFICGRIGSSILEIEQYIGFVRPKWMELRATTEKNEFRVAFALAATKIHFRCDLKP
jgi:hypothetical protein